MALLRINYYSETLKMCTEMCAILPEKLHADKQLKTLYLLHGLSDDHTAWQRWTNIEKYVEGKNIAVIMPTTHRGWYTDMYMGQNWFTFFTEELPGICRGFFPCLSLRREDTFVAGNSMGGYGAFKLALRAPGLFSKAAALSGALDVSEICLNAKNDDKNYFEDVFGPADRVRGSFNDLFAATEQFDDKRFAKPKLYMWCGTEDFLYWQNVKMRNKLKSLDYPLLYRESSGDHRWQYWDEQIKTLVNWLLKEEVNG